MATDAEIKSWLTGQGLRQAGTRGPVSKADRGLYADAHPPEQSLDDLEPDDSDFVAEPGPPPADPETRPRAVATPTAAGKLLDRARRRGGQQKGRKPGRPQPRVPVDDLIAGVWRGLAGFAKPLPATSRLLKLQAPVAGAILEDTVKGTAIDRLLQPVARSTASGQAMFALLGPPVMVTALQLQPQSAPFILPALRESLLMWCRIAGPKMEQALARERDFEDQFGADVDKMIEDLFDGVFVEAPPAAAEATVAA